MGIRRKDAPGISATTAPITAKPKTIDTPVTRAIVRKRVAVDDFVGRMHSVAQNTTHFCRRYRKMFTRTTRRRARRERTCPLAAFFASPLNAGGSGAKSVKSTTQVALCECAPAVKCRCDSSQEHGPCQARGTIGVVRPAKIGRAHV